MEKVSIIGLDIAKSVFQAHGADASGKVVFRDKIRRAKLLEFFGWELIERKRKSEWLTPRKPRRSGHRDRRTW